MEKTIFWSIWRENANTFFHSGKPFLRNRLCKGKKLQELLVLLNITNWFLIPQLLNEFQMTKPEIEYYLRIWSKNEKVSQNGTLSLYCWMSWLHNAGEFQGCWNQKFIGKPKVFCLFCFQLQTILKTIYSNILSISSFNLLIQAFLNLCC